MVTPEQVEKMKVLRAQGLTYREIGEKIGRSSVTVYRHLTGTKQRSVATGKTRYSAEQRQDILAKIKDYQRSHGTKKNETIRALGLAPSTVAGWKTNYKRRGSSKRGPTLETLVTPEEIQPVVSPMANEKLRLINNFLEIVRGL